MLNYFPKYFTNKAIVLYIIALLAVAVVFSRYVMYWYVYLFGLIEVFGFFYFSNVLSKKWALILSKNFEKKIFIIALVIRVIWVIFSYFFYISQTGIPFEYGAADSISYDNTAMPIAKYGLSVISQIYSETDIADTGYPTYLGTIYLIFGHVIIIPRLLKAVLGAWSALLIYRVASRNFGESAGRMAAIFFMLMPNLIYYCGLHLKEVEMVFLTVAFIERADFLLRSRNFNFINTVVPIAIAAIMFTFRTVLGITALFALVTSLLFSTKKILGFGQRFIIGLWVVVAIGFFIGGKISTEVEQLWQNRTDNQELSMNWRAKRVGGNKFADKASSAIFAPSIFIIPVPTMVNIETQLNQQLINGGNFDKDIMAFFILIAFIWIIKYKKWRDFTLLGAFMIGYLGVIALSSFAQSERFHQPALPFILMFATFGISKVTNKTKTYFMGYLVLMFFIILVWNWFKLSGRGLV